MHINFHVLSSTSQFESNILRMKCWRIFYTQNYSQKFVEQIRFFRSFIYLKIHNGIVHILSNTLGEGIWARVTDNINIEQMGIVGFCVTTEKEGLKFRRIALRNLWIIPYLGTGSSTNEPTSEKIFGGKFVEIWFEFLNIFIRSQFG